MDLNWAQILLTQDSQQPWQDAVQCQMCTYKSSRSCSPVGHLLIVPLMLTHQTLDSPPSTILSTPSIASAGPGDIKAFWFQDDEAAFINYLINHKSKAGDGANFKTNVFVGASQEHTKTVSCGSLKTPAACKSKWAQVNTEPCLHLQLTHPFFFSSRMHTGRSPLLRGCEV